MNRGDRRLFLAFAVLVILLWAASSVEADQASDGRQPQDEILSAVVGYVVEQSERQVMGYSQVYQKLELIIASGAMRGEVVVVEQGMRPTVGQGPYKAGDRVYLTKSQDADGHTVYNIVGYARSDKLLWMFLIFVALVVLIARRSGVGALLGMVLSFAIIFAFILPNISKGRSPVAVAVLGAALGMLVSYYLAHGLNRKTTVALAGSLMGLILTGILSVAFVRTIHLSGFASDEAGFLQAMQPGKIDIRGLLLAGMVIGVVGVLDDITVAQSATVQQLSEANSSLNWRQLYSRAMRVGQDHIASMVNTLVLVYAGASLPLLLLLTDRSLPLSYVLSHEVVAEEIVRMLVTSIGLVAAVPITTFLASLVMARRKVAPDS